MSIRFAPAVSVLSITVLANLSGAQNSFVFEAPVTLEPDARGAAAGDFNGDGHLDLLPFTSPLTLLLGDGDGDFSLAEHPYGFVVHAGAIAELTGDTKSDLAIATPDVLIIMKGMPGGLLTQIDTVPVDDPDQVMAIDLDDDLDLDLVVAYDEGVAALANDGSGHFTQIDAMSSGNAAAWIDRFGVGDFDADGDPDIAVGGNGPHLRVFLNDGTGSFDLVAEFEFEDTLCWDVAGADVDLDGDDDLVIATSNLTIGPDTVRVLRSDPGPTWTQTSEVTINVGYAGLWRLACGDLNGDGRPDGVVVDTLEGEAYAMANVDVSGNAVLTPTTMLLTQNQPGSTLLCDVDEDDDLDLVIGSLFFEPLRLYINVTPPEGGDSSDLTGDGLTTPFDLGLLLVNWGLDGLGDINLDGSVDGRDLGVMLGAWSSEDP